tara:strand:- start:416 stop:1417 length:1002 start_codon:yes stop_codon:yes gene_type:complete
MSEKFKAIVLNQSGEQFTREVKTLEKSFLNSGDVLIKIEYSNLNFKDAMILKNGGKLIKEYPRIPGVDLSGTVEESNVPDFKKGEKIIVNGSRVGELYHGGYSQYAKIKKEFIIKKPEGINTKQAMMLGTGGFTAVLCAFAVKAREELLLGEKVNEVLVTGATGGVGSIAVMALSKLGCNVTAITGKVEQSNFLKELGANKIIDRKEFESESKLLDKGRWDGVVDTVGGNILANAIAQTKHSGIVAACGNASGNKLNTSVIPFILRGVKLWGVDSVAISKKRKEFIWGEVSKLINFSKLEKSIKVVSLNELLNVFPSMLEGKLSNKILVDVNK